MRLSVIKHKANNHAAAPWCVIVPRRLSVTGRRQFRYWRTKAEAEKFAASLRESVRKHGEQPITLTATLSAEARTAAAILDGSGLTLVQAAQLIRQLLESGWSMDSLPVTLKLRAREASAANAAAPEEPGAAVTLASLNRPINLHTMGSVLEEIQSVKAHQSAHTKRTRRDRFTAFFRRNKGLADTPIGTLTAEHIRRALDNAWPAAPTSWNSMLTQLNALFNYAVRKGYITRNPLNALDRKHVAEREITPLTPANLRALLRACRPPTAAELALSKDTPAAIRHALSLDTSALAPYIAIAAFAGIRPTEASRLKWGDINLEDGCISVRRTASKTGGARHVDIHPTLAAWLAPLAPHTHPADALIFPGGAGLTKRLQAIHRRAGYGPGNPWPEDALRHSYASYYLKAGWSLNTLQLNMGHSGTALIYNRYCNMSGLTKNMAAEWWSLTPESILHP